MNITDKLKLAREAGVKLPHYTNTDNPIDFPQEKYMNEKIERLAKQAGMVKYPTGLGNIHENTIWGDRNISEFAELLIKECCDVMESLPSSIYHVGRPRMSEEIKQCFGMKS